VLTAEVERCFLSAQTTEGGEDLLGLHNLHKLLGLLDWNIVLEEIDGRYGPIAAVGVSNRCQRRLPVTSDVGCQ
jgi:hypothetical protein